MKAFCVIGLLLFFVTCFDPGFTQSPQALKYQTVVRDTNGNILAGENVTFRFSILKDSINGNETYVETHSSITSDFGFVNLVIGEGILVFGSFSTIDWGNHSCFLKTELDVLNSGSYELMGTSQLLSVPYALFAENVSNYDSDWIMDANDIYSGNSGNVGVGIMDPTEKVHVNGNIKTEDTLKFAGSINHGQVLIDNGDIKVGFSNDNFGNILIGNSLYGKTVFDLGLTGNGNIGIGTDVFHEMTSANSNICLGIYTGYNLSTGSNNVFIGSSAGEHVSSGLVNVSIGNQAGNGRNGDRNVFIGDRAGYAWNGGGSDNIMLGNFAGHSNGASNSRSIYIGKYAGHETISDDNVFIGPLNTGRSSSGTKNIFLGYEVGYGFTGNSHLIIDNKLDNVSPFIKGDMDNDELEINADVDVQGKISGESLNINTVLRLQELTEYPPSPLEGDLIYMNDTLRFYNGLEWKNLW